VVERADHERGQPGMERGCGMTDLGPWYEARKLMRNALEEDLQGGPGDDVLTEPPLDRFIIGILHAQGETDPEENGEQEENDDAAARGEDASFDPAIAMTRRRYPSSMGLTCAVRPEETRNLIVALSASRYAEAADDSAPDVESSQVRHRDGSTSHGSSIWRRTTVERLDCLIDVTVPGTDGETIVDGLELRWVVRAPVDGLVSVTVVLVNTLLAPAQGGRDGYCWFQPSLRAKCETGGFANRPTSAPAGLDDDDVKSSALLFRDVRSLAVGHGCAVTWPSAGAVTELSTTFIPYVEVPLSEATVKGVGALRMSGLAAGDDLTGLADMLDLYENWIGETSADVKHLPQVMQETGRSHMAAAEDALARMRRGLALLEEGSLPMRAFRMMNAAMADQRTRQELIRSGPDGPDDRSQHMWRPFQIAFILLNLEGLTHPESEDREIADLLWFPTGGGKTEAYLGLLAYSILLRRLRNPQDGGVSVIMRYTLRLLTLQQFERAAGLICALELIRQTEMPDAVPISLGLWVGQASTPNDVDSARRALNKLAGGDLPETENPVQLLHCPWCGAELDHNDYRIVERARMVIECPTEACEFADGLPVHLVDQDVYRVRPSLVIATVDKFAMIAWKAEVRALFSSDRAHSAPDLIIQDELHLISGPLGTMVGLYETAVDAAATRPYRPKLVASTATIRRAAKQMAAVFDRQARQFPPAALKADDSFFARPATAAEKGTREYVGVLAPGTSQTTLLVRTYGALLQAAGSLPADDHVRDAYWTLVGYFNSLRVLGGAFMQVIDDVPDRMKVVADRVDEKQREIREPRVMTSRKKSWEIPYELKLLGKSYPDPESPDIMLATNMISVGVDVDRLGLMAVMGQPQATAEYIQATSRVGRKYPGLVVTMYNGARSRDLSHYENFTTYHRTLYRQVEATGATPFAVRARDRGLHGVLVGMARLMIDAAAPEGAAAGIEDWEEEVVDLARQIADRAARVTGENSNVVFEQLETLIERWLDAADQRREKYAGWFDHRETLLASAGDVVKDSELTFPADEAPWPTLTSLRDVDAESSLYLIRTPRRSKR
jgi:hypothetical protein